MGFYVELAAGTGGLKSTGTSSVSGAGGTNVPVDPISGGTVVGINAGIDFDVKREQRWALEYGAVDHTSFTGGSASVHTGGARWDFNIASLSDDLKLRGGLGFGFGAGSSEVTASDGTVVKRTDANGGNVYGGIGVAYYIGKHLVVHGQIGPKYQTEQLPGGGSIAGIAWTVKLGISWVLGNTIPDFTTIVPMKNNTDITPALLAGAEDIGCHAERVKDRKNNTFAAIFATCGGQKIFYFQDAHSLMVSCEHMFEKQCTELNGRIMDAALKSIDAKKAPPPVTAPPAPTMPTPTPAPTTPPPSAPPTSTSEPTRQ